MSQCAVKFYFSASPPYMFRAAHTPIIRSTILTVSKAIGTIHTVRNKICTSLGFSPYPFSLQVLLYQMAALVLYSFLLVFLKWYIALACLASTYLIFIVSCIYGLNSSDVHILFLTV